MANIIVAYIFWVSGGLFGLHHFYLGRDKHAFVWFMSLGGFFFGWLRDLWRLPEYVCEANRDIGFINEFTARRRYRTKPPFHVVRFAGQILIGCILAYLCRLAIPEATLKDAGILGSFLMVALPILGAAIGVSLVANIGTQKTDFKWCLLGSACGLVWLLQEEQSLIACALLSSMAASWKCEWDPTKLPPRGKCRCITRVFTLSICGMIYLAMFGSMIYFNVHITSADGVSVPIHEAVHNFFQSPAWKEMKQTMGKLYEFCQINGWGKCYYLLLEQLDPTGETHAHKVLEFEDHERPTPEDIQARCRQLSRKWHPDKYKSKTEKEEAQAKFIEIQGACDSLDSIRKKRTEKNMKSDTSSRRSTKKEKEDL